jgi:Tol biopolymer transport system component
MDGLTLYFTSDRTGASRLYRSTRSSTTAAFGAPLPVNELATISLSGPALSADGGELFYSDWAESTVIRATYSPANGFVPDGSVAALDFGFANAGPSLSGDGRTIYYQHKEGLIAPFDIYVAHRSDPGGAFDTAVALAELDMPDADTGNPEISKDERTIVFSSNRPGGSGGYDLYLANRSCQ